MKLIEKYAFLIGDICKDQQTGKKKLQKLMYLIERKGVQLDLRYSIHFFGPYSARLDHAIHILENEEWLDIDTSRQTHRIIMKESASTQLEEENALAEAESALVDEVRAAFYDKSPMELEALTTIDYVATTLLHGTATRDDVINQVKMIKGKKFSSQELEKEYDVLIEQGYLSA
jgi:hypothetical protein